MRSLFTALACFVLLVPAFAQVPRDKAAEYDRNTKEGVELIRAQKFDEGIAAFKRCVELVPEDAGSAYNLACCYSLKKEADTSFEWFNKSIDWGFVFVQIQNLTWPDTDTDLDNVRADPRYAQCMERMKAQSKKAEDFYSKPVVYVPDALKSADTVPLLVVLHDGGSTKDTAFAKGPWKKLADELGTALILPSGKVPVKFKPDVLPADGMSWLGADYSATTAWRYEKTVDDAVTAFKKEHKLDPARVLIAGEGQGALVAFNIAVSKPGLYKGVVCVSGLPALQLAQNKLANAIKMGQRAYFALDGQSAFGLDDMSKLDDTIKALDAGFKKAGMTVVIERFERKADDPEQLVKLLSPQLKTLGTPAPAAPTAPVEAGGDKKQ